MSLRRSATARSHAVSANHLVHAYPIPIGPHLAPYWHTYWAQGLEVGDWSKSGEREGLARDDVPGIEATMKMGTTRSRRRLGSSTRRAFQLMRGCCSGNWAARSTGRNGRRRFCGSGLCARRKPAYAHVQTVRRTKSAVESVARAARNCSTCSSDGTMVVSPSRRYLAFRSTPQASPRPTSSRYSCGLRSNDFLQPGEQK